jgi:ribosomal protein L37E
MDNGEDWTDWSASWTDWQLGQCTACGRQSYLRKGACAHPGCTEFYANKENASWIWQKGKKEPVIFQSIIIIDPSAVSKHGTSPPFLNHLQDKKTWWKPGEMQQQLWKPETWSKRGTKGKARRENLWWKDLLNLFGVQLTMQFLTYGIFVVPLQLAFCQDPEAYYAKKKQKGDQAPAPAPAPTPAPAPQFEGGRYSKIISSEELPEQQAITNPGALSGHSEPEPMTAPAVVIGAEGKLKTLKP